MGTCVRPQSPFCFFGFSFETLSGSLQVANFANLPLSVSPPKERPPANHIEMVNEDRPSDNVDQMIEIESHSESDSEIEISDAEEYEERRQQMLAEEGAELQELNQRHANIVNRHRALVDEKNTLKEQLRIIEENAEKRMQECQASVERRMEQIQNKLELESLTSEQRANEIKQLQAKVNDLEQKLKVANEKLSKV